MLAQSRSYQNTLYLCALLILCTHGFFRAAPAAAQTVNLSPVKDVTLYEPDNDKANGSGDYLFAGNTDGAGLRRALLAFDVAGNVPAGVTVESVSLTLYMSRTVAGSQVHTLHRVTQNWGEGASNADGQEGAPTSAENNDATWEYTFYNAGNPSVSPTWNSLGGDFAGTASASTSVGGNGFYTWSSAQMVADVQNWLDNPTTNFGWMVRGHETQLKTAKRFNARESSNASRHPTLVITYGQPATPPDVTVIAPNGGETVVGNSPASANWTATDESGISGIDLYLSLDNGTTWDPVALGIPNTPPYTWYPPNRPTTQARIRIVATDNTLVSASDDSDGAFTIESPPGGRVPTTLRDFDQPGSQPFDAGTLNDPQGCAVCHSNYGQTAVEPYFNWHGSMMAQASLDPLFEACLAVANQDAPDSGDLCLRCHNNRAWLRGRSVPTDGSEVLLADEIGVSCDLCHRLVDPIPDPANPVEDTAILAALSNVPAEFGTGMFVVDPTGARRGPFVDATSGHPVLVSPFHREAALCGTCHDVSNPAFTRDVNGDYLPNAFDTPASDFSPHSLGVVERTYSEWLNSDYNTPQGVLAPEFGGNLTHVSTCQDCHMRDVTGKACNHAEAPTRNDLPLHDMTGGSTWLPGLLPAMFPGRVDSAALLAGIDRARYMLQNAAKLEVLREGASLRVTVTNNTGHKLPTGYPEGRRIWINVQFRDDSMTLIGESGAYDATTGVLSHDAEAKIYETEPGTEGIPTLPDGTLFHFVLNNKVYKDNRIPPRGFSNVAYDAFGGAPVGYSYADGQYWDDTVYGIPAGATTATITLFYQSTSKEYVEFLRDENTTNTKGQEMYDLWANNGKCPPEQMAQVQISVAQGDADGDGDIDLGDYAVMLDCFDGPNVAPTPSPPATEADCLSIFDFDADNDVDLLDFAEFGLRFTLL